LALNRSAAHRDCALRSNLAVFYPDPGSFCARELPVEQGAGQAPWMKNSGTGGRSLEELRNP